MRPFPALLLAALALLLGGCLEGEEEIWLERDGSGRLEATYRMEPAVASEFGGAEEFITLLREAAARDPHVALTHLSHRKERGKIILEFGGTFDDFRKLCTFPQRQLRNPDEPDVPVKSEALFGTIDLKINPLRISYHRTVDLSAVLPDGIKRAPGILEDASFRYVLNLPVVATKSNAHNFAPETRRLEWSFLLKDHVSTPMTLTAQGRIPWPPWIFLLPILLLVSGLLVLRRLRSPGRLNRSEH